MEEEDLKIYFSDLLVNLRAQRVVNSRSIRILIKICSKLSKIYPNNRFLDQIKTTLRGVLEKHHCSRLILEKINELFENFVSGSKKLSQMEKYFESSDLEQESSTESCNSDHKKITFSKEKPEMKSNFPLIASEFVEIKKSETLAIKGNSEVLRENNVG